MDYQAGVNYVNERNWPLLDMENVQTSKSHKCIRELCILEKNGFRELKLEFYPCKQFKDLKIPYKRVHWYCQANIQHLSYYPDGPSSPCLAAKEKLQNFIKNNNIDLILCKGGKIEDYC